ncbi:MAG: hypothetical protein NTZ44_01215 [Candidatus Nomurabacteria bacterium]|nr:hypothetical protein [Candidatus Nomurabacteria bacterium]
MSKKNFTILIIILVSLTVLMFGIILLFPQSKPAQIIKSVVPSVFPVGNMPSTNTNTPPANVSGLGGLVPFGTDNLKPTIEVNKLKLQKISSFPVAGFGVYNKEIFKEVAPIIPPVATAETATTTATGLKPTDKKSVIAKPTPPATVFITAVRYVDKKTGNIYQNLADNINERQFTSTIIAKVHDAFFGNNSGTVAMRYLKDDNLTIESFLGNLPKEVLGGDTTADTDVKGVFLPENITDLSISPDKAKLFYIFNLNKNAIGVSSGILGDKKSQIFSSPFTEWLTQWPNEKMITLTTKPSTNVPGYMYSIDPSKKDFKKVLGSINGLTTNTSPSGRLVLYSSSKNNSINLYLYNTDTGRSDLLGVKTLPEKCVWTKASDEIYCAVPGSLDRASYPDDWYQGIISFGDQIWKIDATNESATTIADPVVISGEEVDGIKLALDDSENFLFFVNKKDSYLWQLNLK